MSEYYGLVRRDIDSLLPKTASRIVDVGCGVGATASWLKTRYPDAWTIGLEGQAGLLEELSRNVDEAHIVDLEGDIPDIGTPDLILMLDVLEHLRQPERVLKSLVSRLAPEGRVIVSLPNVAHLSVSLPLLLSARFTYTDQGITDRTHLRFFVKSSAVDLLEQCGLRVLDGVLTGLHGPKTRLADLLTFGALRDRLAKQYIMSASPGVGGPSGPARWRRAEVA